MLLMSKSTVYSQIISPTENYKCFTYEECRVMFKDIKRANIGDSIIQNQELQIINYKTILSNSNEQISLLNGQVTNKQKELNTANLKLKISKRLTTFGIPISLGLGFIVGIIIK